MRPKDTDAPHTRTPARTGTDALETAEELPVVARLVVEIRSDGTRTVARGAIEDLETGQRVALQAGGGTPWELVSELTRGLTALPRWAGGRLASRVFGLLPRRKP